MKGIAILTFAAMIAVAAIAPTTAEAGGRRITSGFCPAGTLSDNCTRHAGNVSHCTVANYKRCTGKKKSGKRLSWIEGALVGALFSVVGQFE
jgi:hypothetical protein